MTKMPRNCLHTRSFFYYKKLKFFPGCQFLNFSRLWACQFLNQFLKFVTPVLRCYIVLLVYCALYLADNLSAADLAELAKLYRRLGRVCQALPSLPFFFARLCQVCCRLWQTLPESAAVNVCCRLCQICLPKTCLPQTCLPILLQTCLPTLPQTCLQTILYN